MNAPLMPKATAVWLVSNTALTFQQIADFCEMHPLEIQGIADGEIAAGIAGEDPTINGQLTKKEIEKCERDESARLELLKVIDLQHKTHKKKRARYTPIARRQDKPDAVMWLFKHYPNITDLEIIKLIGTTKSTIEAVKHKEHWNASNIRPRDPVLLGLCSQSALNALVEAIEARQQRDKTKA